MIQELGNGNTIYSEGVNEIILSIDFVEFEDGSSWGQDYFKSAERVAGQRAGIKFAVESYGKKLENSPFDVFSNEIEKNAIDFAFHADKSKSSVLRDGFQSGVGLVRNRLDTAIGKDGTLGAKQELQKLSDAINGRP